MLAILRRPPALLMSMALGLLLLYWGGTLPAALLGLALFGALALLRPDLALLFVPFTAPLYLMPAALPGLRASGFDLPLHEAALLLTCAAVAIRWLWGWFTAKAPRHQAGPQPQSPQKLGVLVSWWLRPSYAPQLLFLLAGLLGVALAVERGPAFTEFRRLVAEPLLFYALVVMLPTADRRPPTGLLVALALAGALVGLLGLLQYAGLDLVPLLGRKLCFAPDGGPCANVVGDGGLRRVQSVYGHPNNLGLFLGRAWPIAAALALAALQKRKFTTKAPRHQVQNNEPRTTETQLKHQPLGVLVSWWLYPKQLRGAYTVTCWVFASLLCLGGLLVSFSRGAWLGALVAAAVLALGMLRTKNQELRTRFALRRYGSWFFVLGSVLALAALALTLRGDLRGGSTGVRLLLWREALGYLWLHPLGIGLDQFLVYHSPGSGRSLIDPALVGTSEQYAAHPHNLLLDTWLRVGPLGLLAFAWLLLRLFRTALWHARQPLQLGLLAAMAAALTHGLVDNFYFVPDLAIVFWLLIALSEQPDRL